MLTNNFYKTLWDEFVYGRVSINDLMSTGGEVKELGRTGYDIMYPLYYLEGVFSPSTDQTSSEGTNGYGGLIIGDGNTPPTIDDYKLENQITSGFSYRLSYPTDNADVVSARKFILNLSVTNTSSDNLTIREIGYIRSSQAMDYSWNHYLMDRTVFDTPVVIAPGATKTFEYRLNMPRP